MTATDPDTLAAAKERLASVSALLSTAEDTTRQLRDERDDLLRRLKHDGVPPAELRSLGCVTPANLKWILSERSRVSRSKSGQQGAR